MFSNRPIQLPFALIATLFIIGGLWYFTKSDEDSGAQQAASVWNIVGEESVTNNQIQNAERYMNEPYGFSFIKPETFSAISSPYGDVGEVIVFEPSEASSEGWQIFIIPFDESSPITPERIRIDLPDIVMKNVRQATLADTPALVFDSVNEEVGETYEIWFARNGYLYQIMTYKGFEDEMNAILQTWKFE